jgi:hypothetical protein
MSAPFAAKVTATYAITDSFRAWRVREPLGGFVVPVDATGDTLPDALATACNATGHGDTLLIEQTAAHTERKALHVYRIRAGKREYRRDPYTGSPVWVSPLKPDLLVSFGVEVFDPVEPFDALAILRGAA